MDYEKPEVEVLGSLSELTDGTGPDIGALGPLAQVTGP